MQLAASFGRGPRIFGLCVALCTASCQREKANSTLDPTTPRAAVSVVIDDVARQGREPAAGSSATPPSASAPAVRTAGAPAEPGRVYAKTRFVWVRPEPDAQTQWIGFLWIGGSAELRRSKPYYGPGCGTWYAIKPRGFVCVDGTRATLDAHDPALLAMLPYAPQLTSAWPHRYGESRGLKRYRSLPNPEQQLALLPNLPPTIFEDRNDLSERSTVAFSRELSVDGRQWLLSADYMWVEKERVEPYPEVTFEGVKLSGQTRLPIALFREPDRRGFRKIDGAGSVQFEATGEAFARLSWVKLSGVSERVGNEVYWESTTPGIFVKASDAVIPTPMPAAPWAKDDSAAATTPAGAARRSWVEVSVWQGWLIAYEDNEPVFTTLISPGRGGTPVPGKTTLETSSTPTGTFSITGKFATATMEAPNEFIHSSVPWAQNFSGPYALHAAYWHNDWGKLKSGGCINLSPRDAKWLYEFTDPVVPPGWHGVRWLPWLGPATRLVVHR